MTTHLTPDNKLQKLDARSVALSQIAHLEDQLASLKATLQCTTCKPNQEHTGASALRQLLHARRARDRFFEPGLFADPAWDILLEAYAAHLSGDQTSTSALCEAAAVPATTAVRWLKSLEREGLLIRRDDPIHEQRSWMELTPAAAVAMRRYLAAISTSSSI